MNPPETDDSFKVPVLDGDFGYAHWLGLPSGLCVGTRAVWATRSAWWCYQIFRGVLAIRRRAGTHDISIYIAPLALNGQENWKHGKHALPPGNADSRRQQQSSPVRGRTTWSAVVILSTYGPVLLFAMWVSHWSSCIKLHRSAKTDAVLDLCSCF